MVKIEKGDKRRFIITSLILLFCLFIYSTMKFAIRTVSLDPDDIIGQLYFDEEITISYYFQNEQDGIVTHYLKEGQRSSYPFIYTRVSEQEMLISYQDKELEFYILNKALLDKTNHVLLRLYEE